MCEHVSFNPSSSSTSIPQTAKLSSLLCSFGYWIWKGSSILFEWYFGGNTNPWFGSNWCSRLLNPLNIWCASGNQRLNKYLCLTCFECLLLTSGSEQVTPWWPYSAPRIASCSFLKPLCALAVGAQHASLSGGGFFLFFLMEMRHTICLRGWEIWDAIEWMPKLHQVWHHPGLAQEHSLLPKEVYFMERRGVRAVWMISFCETKE